MVGDSLVHGIFHELHGYPGIRAIYRLGANIERLTNDIFSSSRLGSGDGKMSSYFGC